MGNRVTDFSYSYKRSPQSWGDLGVGFFFSGQTYKSLEKEEYTLSGPELNCHVFNICPNADMNEYLWEDRGIVL